MVDGIQEFIESLRETPVDTIKTYSAVVSRIDDEGVVWVYLAGSNKETPVASASAEVKNGDNVNVEWRNNKLYIAGNVSNPSAGVTRVKVTENVANTAIQDASRANEAANIAFDSANVAKDSAVQALTSATEASASAMDAKKSARDADEAIYGTISYRYTHEVGGQSVTEIVYQRIDGTYYYLDGDDEIVVDESALDRDAYDAIIVVRDENGLDADLRAAVSMVTDIRGYAEDTYNYAVQTANTAGSAIGQLGEIEKVVQTLSWIREHGEYSLTTDTEVQSGKWYFEYNASSNSYELANPNPDANPSSLGLYELTSVDESVSNYLSTHLALSSDALWVQMDESAYRLKVSANGIYLCNEIGDYIAQYTTSVILGNQTGAHIELDPQTGLGFYENATNRVAYIDSNKLFITNAEITENLRIGKFLWKLQGANRISFVYSP